MVSLHVATSIDLTGQVAADARLFNHFSGISGMMDFIRGSAESPGGKSILMLPSTTLDEKSSRIVPQLKDTAVVVPRGEVQYVATEFGVVNLFGKSLQERAMALISIAHTDFREELFCRARELELLGPERSLSESILSVYPLRFEEIRELNGRQVLFRPAKPVDERLIQEHFYNLDQADVAARFLQERLSFPRREMAGMVQVDYVKNMAIVAVLGESGFEKVIGIGAYFWEPARNMAEVAFSVLKKWQGKGLSTVILNKLAEAAREQGIFGLTAYTKPENQGMINLFNKLPYKVQAVFEEDMLCLSLRFQE
jgi:RimJ/RimL family protein N-acetyltransferase